MHIVVLGPNGKVGRLVAAKLLEHGHTVIACVHTHHEHVPKQAHIATIDLTNTIALTKVLTGADAVICALGSWGSKNHDVLSTAMKSVVPAMSAAGVKRFISISGDIAILPGEKPRLVIRLARALMFGIPKKVIQDSEDHIRQVVASDLDWTIIRPGIMTNSNNDHFSFHATHCIAITIPRVAVVASIVSLLETGDHVHESPFVTN